MWVGREVIWLFYILYFILIVDVEIFAASKKSNKLDWDMGISLHIIYRNPRISGKNESLSSEVNFGLFITFYFLSLLFSVCIHIKVWFTSSHQGTLTNSTSRFTLFQHVNQEKNKQTNKNTHVFLLLPIYQ